MADSTDTHLSDRLTRACDALALPITPAQHGNLLDYVGQMQKWNRTYNLTAVRDPAQMLVTHVFDSLGIIEPLDRWLDERQIASPIICDVGSGGGLPAVVLAIMRAQWRVSSVDKVEKKTAFVRQVGARLKLANLSALHARIETLPAGGCDIVVSRAFASLTDFANLAGAHVNYEGNLLAMKGKVPDQEIGELNASGMWRIEQIQSLVIPELDAKRCLLWMRRRQGTQ